jgi:23S rRNA (cytidine1920-2'-O)/16S rRNA (cytidine1409-2'-O)-methyltransferase
MEKTNARFIDRISFDPKPEIAVIDVSFISITKILEPLIKVLSEGFQIIALLKPQFELDKSKIGKKGLVSEEYRQEAVRNVLAFSETIGLRHSEVIESPITGLKSGNVEYLCIFTQ